MTATDLLGSSFSGRVLCEREAYSAQASRRVDSDATLAARYVALGLSGMSFPRGGRTVLSRRQRLKVSLKYVCGRVKSERPEMANVVRDKLRVLIYTERMSMAEAASAACLTVDEARTFLGKAVKTYDSVQTGNFFRKLRKKQLSLDSPEIERFKRRVTTMGLRKLVEFEVLSLILNGPRSVATLMEMMELSRLSCWKRCRRLSIRGFVDMRRDGRRSIVTMTPLGEQAWDKWRIAEGFSSRILPRTDTKLTPEYVDHPRASPIAPDRRYAGPITDSYIESLKFATSFNDFPKLFPDGSTKDQMDRVHEHYRKFSSTQRVSPKDGLRTLGAGLNAADMVIQFHRLIRKDVPSVPVQGVRVLNQIGLEPRFTYRDNVTNARVSIKDICGIIRSGLDVQIFTRGLRYNKPTSVNVTEITLLRAMRYIGL